MITKTSMVVVFISVADMLLTAYGLSVGLFEEANPILAWIYLNFGLHGFVLYKLVLLILVVGIMEYIFRNIRTKREQIYARMLTVLAVYVQGAILLYAHSVGYYIYFTV